MVMLTTCLGGMGETILGPVAQMHPASWGKFVLVAVPADDAVTARTQVMSMTTSSTCLAAGYVSLSSGRKMIRPSLLPRCR